jgi:CPA2 family monovalent cation:H+ antiporter-2
MVVGRSEFSLRTAADALPMRDAFAVLFFVSVGMLLDPHALLASPWPTVATLLIVLIAKPLAAFGIVRALRYPTPVAIGVGVALAQVGEFSFILAALGKTLGILPDSLNDAIIVTAIISIALNPVLYRLIDRVAEWMDGGPEKKKDLEPQGEAVDDEPSLPSHHAVIIGFGPVGRTLKRLLSDNEIDSTIIEMNHGTVRELQEQGHAVVYGDASQRATLEAADIDHAATLILSASGLKNAAEVIRVARELNPRLRVFARASYLREEPSLRRAGADVVFTGEGEVALAMTTHLLDELGALPEQIDRERDRVREELFTGNHGQPESH